jgi:hypothetical protein
MTPIHDILGEALGIIPEARNDATPLPASGTYAFWRAIARVEAIYGDVDKGSGDSRMIPRILNLRNGLPLGAVRVDRSGPWGNPFPMRDKSEAERDRVCDAFEAWAMAPERATFRAEARRALAGKDLACWCAPKRCHAETLRRIANDAEISPHDAPPRA